MAGDNGTYTHLTDMDCFDCGTDSIGIQPLGNALTERRGA
jgi:hypothetical protein